MPFVASHKRYESMVYSRCGRSGLDLPAISLGLWHNFGGMDRLENCRAMLLRAFDLGVTHFDLANNYGPPPGAAEESLGRVLAGDLRPYRDELILSTKAGYHMWPGPYGDWGSRKYLLASLDQSLRRMGVEYVDIFYSHRPDPRTPIEETMSALDRAVRAGKALYAGISSYDPEQTRRAAAILRGLGTPCLIHQVNYSLLDRRLEQGLQAVLAEEGIGTIAFCPLSQGLLTNRYLEGIPNDSRAGRSGTFLRREQVKPEVVARVRRLQTVATARGQTLAQMSLAWVLREGRVASALIGASRLEQIEENVGCLRNRDFSSAELMAIDAALAE
jgi:L-glyceraldehyde 3-phosphate reductase